MEYKDKSILLEYFIDIGTELIKLCREHNEISVSENALPYEVNDNHILCKQLFSLYKEKVTLYKKIKDQKKQIMYDIKIAFRPGIDVNNNPNKDIQRVIHI